MGCWVYILRCADQTLYSGATTDLTRRIQAHNDGKGAKYTRSRTPVQLMQSWQVANWSQALRLEAGLKKIPKVLKEELIQDPLKIEEWAIHAGYNFSIQVDSVNDNMYTNHMKQ
ncbi:GIY-YIG nuclease family protein [Desulfitobacterium sp. AusDCA]|uniref:GIY-YIG nuclease family protein n=1 Tax=Desulfitobacterium sp. AusDCA TaxID=3240383 RepID=UPI003DA77A6B